MSKQCKIYDMLNNTVSGGVLFEDGSAMCMCCGGFLPVDERNDTWKVLKIYDYWVNLSQEVLGDDSDDINEE